MTRPLWQHGKAVDELLKGRRMVPEQVFLRITLPARIEKQGNWYVSSCSVLDIASQGKTERKARENLVEAIVLFFISCYERGQLDAAMKECGLLAKTSRRHRTQFPRETVPLDIPIPFSVDPAKLEECHA